MQLKKGSLFLFRLFGVNVFLHWSWALVAVIQVWRQTHPLEGGAPHTLPFYALQYLCLFVIVLMHEFGHALACKSVGGVAERIVLWPLGGVAYVQPPSRPGALLWAIAAGPLVNVILLPVTIIPAVLAGGMSLHAPPVPAFLFQLALINLVILVFNILPVYPLDGGQILRALAWFVVGRGTSLIVAAAIGIAGTVGLVVLALFAGSPWLAILAAFMGWQSFRGIQIGMILRRIDITPRHPDARCPTCGENPPAGAFWQCPCGARFDTFAANARCPACARPFSVTACPFCGKAASSLLWYPPAYPVAPPIIAPAIAQNPL